jgi:ABC-2 type transport system permease protein
VKDLIPHTTYMAVRHLRALVRQPMYIAITLFQPIVYLLLLGALFERVADLPGFASGSYITFLTPGIVVLSAFINASWSGMGMLEDMGRGVIDRFLTSPVSRVALIAGRLVHVAVVTLIQSAILIGLGLIAGARFEGGPVGILVLVVCAILLAAPFAALLNGLALLVPKQESVMGASQFVLVPLIYLASVFMAADLMPGWMQVAAQFNPVNWAVVAGRAALAAQVDWALVLSRAGFLLVFAVASAWLAQRAFRTYQRSV